MTAPKTEEKKENANGVICEVQKSETEIIRISTTEFKGTSYVDIRIFFRQKDTGEYRPTKKGLTVTSELFREIVKGITEAGE